MSIEEVMASPVPSPLALAGTTTALEALPDLIEVLPIAIYACDVEGRVLWFNGRAAEIWGRRPLLGSQPEKYTGAYRVYFDGREMSRDETAMASVLKSGVPIRAFESQLERPDGSRVWVTTHVEPVKDDNGQLRGAISCFHESTGSHEVTEALRESEHRLHELLAAIPAAIYTTDAAGKITYYNEAAVEFAGRRPTIGTDRMVHHLEDVLAGWHPAAARPMPDGCLAPRGASDPRQGSRCRTSRWHARALHSVSYPAARRQR